MIDASGFLTIIYDEVDRRINAAISERIGTVVSFHANGSPKIKFDGDDTPSDNQFKRLAGYIPAINDRVILVRVRGFFVIYGKIEG